MSYAFTKEQQEEILKRYKDLDLSWYQSTRGPQISATVKFLIAGMVLNMAKIFFGIEIGPEWVNLLVDAALVVFMGAGMLWGYWKGKRALLGQVATERYEAAKLGASLLRNTRRRKHGDRAVALTVQKKASGRPSARVGPTTRGRETYNSGKGARTPCRSSPGSRR